MNIKENINDKNSDKISFWKANRVLFAFLLLAILLICTYYFVSSISYLSPKDSDEDISIPQTTTLFSVDKVVCYSSAYGTSQDESQGKWNLNLGQYTDIAIYFNAKENVSSIYIDNISFERSDIGNLSLSVLDMQDFAKSPSENFDIQTPERIEVNSSSPICIRYLNHNFKENCVISDIENPLTFDGSLLKRGKVLLSSLKNTVSFTIHITNEIGNEFIFPISVPINLENKDEGLSIYDGSYAEELQFSNAYFFTSTPHQSNHNLLPQ